MSTSDTLTLMTSDRIRRSLKRMSHQINEANKTDRPLLLLGVNHRGLAVAKLLAEHLNEIIEQEISVENLRLDKNIPENQEWKQKKYKRDLFIIIVDDVIFSGQTMFTALTTVVKELDPQEIHSAVLVDRGHRKFPVKAEFYGMDLPTKLNEHVKVIVKDGEVRGVQLDHR
jgi:pyrimidine operon attenuation protein/uracil phosphoribosyltransferase